MFAFHKPDWLYEALPTIYIGAGIATIVNLGNTLSIVSGGLLISAGFFIWRMRQTYRHEQRSREAERRAAQRRVAERRAVELKVAELRDTELREAAQMEAERREAERREVERREADRRNSQN